jgi:hypothetical protein
MFTAEGMMDGENCITLSTARTDAKRVWDRQGLRYFAQQYLGGEKDLN